RAVFDRRRVGAEDEPARLLAVAVGAEVDARACRRLGRDDPRELFSVAAIGHRDLGDPPQLLVQRHFASLDSRNRGRDPLRTRARALRAARADLRPLRAPALARPGSALAAVPRLAAPGRTGGHG